MSVFFYICEYFKISPQEFFDTQNNIPEQLNSIVQDLKCLDKEQLDYLSPLIKDLKK